MYRLNMNRLHNRLIVAPIVSLTVPAIHIKDRVCRFGAPLSTFGISAELNIHFMNVIHQFEENY